MYDRALIVVYDQGAVSPTGILQKISSPLIVVLAASAHAQRMRPLFAESCDAVYDLADGDLVAKLGRHRPKGIQTFSEPMLAATSDLATALGLPFHDAIAVRLLTSKDAQRQRLRDVGVDKTASLKLTDVGGWEAAVTRIGLPVVVKPERGVGSRNTILVNDLDTGRALVGPVLEEEGAVVIEEYLSGIPVPEPWGDYVSVETVVHHGKARHLPVTGKLRLAPPFRECGQFWPARLDPSTHADVLTLADSAITSLNIVSGILHTEIKLTPVGPRIIEVNGRVGGFIPELAAHAAGVDLVDIAARIACGEPVNIPPVEPDRVYLQLTTPAPVKVGTVTAVCRRADLGHIPGLVGYTLLVRRGDAVGGFGTKDLNLVSVEVVDHDAVVPVIGMILDQVEFGFQFDSRQVTCSARDLVYHTLEKD